MSAPVGQHHVPQIAEPLLRREIDEEHHGGQEHRDRPLRQHAEARRDVHQAEIQPAALRPRLGKREEQQHEPHPHRDVDVDDDAARQQQQPRRRREHERGEQPGERPAKQPAETERRSR